MSMTDTLSLPHHYILGADNLFSSLKGTLLEKNFASQWFISKDSTILDLHNLDDEIWVFWAIEI